MLEFMRKNAGSKLVWLIIAAISIVFIFFGIGSQGGGGRLITVGGEEISHSDYDRMAKMIDQNTRGNDEGLPPEIRERQIQSGAVAGVITEALIRQFSRNIGLAPTDRAVARYIYGLSEFQVEGRFDKELYEARVARFGPAQFEKDVRRDMTTSRASVLLGSLAQAYPPEARQLHRFYRDMMKLEYIFFPAEPHTGGLAPTDEALAEFYGRNQERWRRPASMIVEYVEILPSDFLSQAEVTEEELRQAFSDSGQRFNRPETLEASHILFKYPNMNPTDEEKEATRLRAQEAAQRATVENFASLAEELSDDPVTAPSGGALGSFSSDMPLFGLTEDLFSLPLQTVSPPLQSPVGYHLFLITDRREPQAPDFEEARDILTADLKAFKARQLAVAKLEDLIMRAETSPSLNEAAQSLGLTAQTSPPFTRDDAPAFFEGDPAALGKAFQAPVDEVAAPVEGRTHLALYAPLERTESYIPPLGLVKEDVAEAWVEYEAARLADLEALNFIQTAEARGWAEAAAARADLGRGETDLGTRQDLIEAGPLMLADMAGLLAALSSVAETGQIVPAPVSGRHEGAMGSFALRLAEFQSAPEVEPGSPELMRIMISESMNRGLVMHQAWVEELYRSSAEKIYIPEYYTR